MDLLNNESQPKEENQKSKKLVLKLLIFSIMASIMILIMIMMLKGEQPKSLTLTVNNANVQIGANMIISDENGISYISIEQLSRLIGYDYLRGVYKKYEENDSKCYLENEYQIIGFESGSNEIYKTTQTSEMDYEIYKLNNKIIQSNGLLYIALEDLTIGCNAICEYLKEDNKIVIASYENLIQNYNPIFTEKGLTISEENQNKKAIVYNMVVANNAAGKIGVYDTKLNTIIGHKYTTMQFDEFSQSFIVSNKDKYGVVSTKGETVIELKYEGIRIINYMPLLYEVKLNNKVGVIDEDGEILVNIEYDKLGCESSSSIMESTFIIKKLNNKNDAIVVLNNQKYGLVNLTTGETILNCELDKIYSKKDNSGKKQYYVQVKDSEISLSKYIDYVNTTTVVTN